MGQWGGDRAEGLWGGDGERDEEASWGDGNVSYPDLGGTYTGVYIRKNPYTTQYI